MKNKILQIGIALLLMAVPYPAMAIAEDEDNQICPQPPPDIIISELSLIPRADDVQWVELFNGSDQIIDLSNWTLDNLNGDQMDLDGLVEPGQYRIYYSDLFLIETTDTLSLTDHQGQLKDEWEFDLTIAEGQTLILHDDALAVSDLPTAARPNVLVDNGVIVEETEEVTSQTDQTIDNTSIEPALETGDISINEVYPNPAGDETQGEFVELINHEDRAINLEGWQLADASKSYTLADLVIDANSLIILPRTLTAIALNNGSETVTLTDPFGVDMDTMGYSSTTEGLSLNYQPVGLWYEADPSPGAANNEAGIDLSDSSDSSDSSGEIVTDTSDLSNNTAADTTTDQSKVTVINSGLVEIRLNELMPNPEGSDDAEWIELFNPSDNTIELTGLTVSDRSNSFIFDEGSIGPRDFFILHRQDSHISLNNSNETLSLLVEDVVIDEFTYESSKEALSWAIDSGGEWALTTSPTPGEVNDIAEELVATASVAKKKTTAKKKAATKAAALPIEFADWEDTDDRLEVELSGVITVVPGTFNARTSFFEGLVDDKPYPIELYFHKAQWPSLGLYQKVTITGEKSTTKTGPRLLIRSADDVALSDIVDYTPYAIESLPQLDSLPVNTLVQLSGVLIEQGSKDLLVGVGKQEFVVDIKAASLTLKQIKSEATIPLTGIIKKKSNSWQLLPRRKEDVVIDRDSLEQDSPVVSSILPQPPGERAKKMNVTTIMLLILGAALSAVILLISLYHKAIREQLKNSLLLIRKRLPI